MAKKKEVPLTGTINIKPITIDVNDVEITKRETFNSLEAEKLQKDGWRLLDITQTSNGKLYKFER